MIQLALIAAVIFPAPAQDKPEDKLQAVLKKLSDFAREVDSGKRELAKARRTDGQPDGLMIEFRTLVHENPSLNEAVLKYLKSEKEPLSARALAVVSIARPHRSSVAEVLGSLYTDPPDLKLAVVAAFGYHNVGDKEIDWDFALRMLGFAAIAPGWQMPMQTISGPLRFLRGAPADVDLSPMLEGILKLLDRPGIGVMEHRGLSLAYEWSRRQEATELQRQRVRSFMEKTYLGGGTGWHQALDYLAGSHRKPTEADLEVLGRGLARLDPQKRARVMDEICNRFPGCLAKEPFRKYHDEVIAYLSKTEKEGGSPDSTLYEVTWALLNEPGAEARAEEMIFKSPSITIRRRAASTLASRCGYVKKVEGWDRWGAQMKRMLLDPDFVVGLVAAMAVAEELEKRESLFTQAERSLWWARATEWANTKDAKTLDPTNTAHLNDIRIRLSVRKP